jgi:predicted ArsR family transcriptional regulator
MFDGTRRAYSLLVYYIIQNINRIGTDPAIEVLQEAAERQGIAVAREMRRQLPKDLTPLQMGAEVYRRFMSDAGAEVEVHKRDDSSVTFRVGRCPFHEAFLDAGVDCGYFLNGLCSNLTLPTIQATLNQLDPRLRVETVVTRQAAEDLCLERVTLAEA